MNIKEEKVRINTEVLEVHEVAVNHILALELGRELHWSHKFVLLTNVHTLINVVSMLEHLLGESS